MLGPDLPFGLDALGAEAGRHADVDDGDVGLVARDGVQEVAGVAGLGHHLQPGVAQHGDDALADEHAVVGYDDAHGTSSSHDRARPGRADHAERAAHGRDPVAEPGQAAVGRGRRPAAAVVARPRGGAARRRAEP